MVALTWISNTFSRPLAKRSAIIAIVNLIGNAPNIHGSYLYPARCTRQQTLLLVSISGLPISLDLLFWFKLNLLLAGLRGICILLVIALCFDLFCEDKKITQMVDHPELDAIPSGSGLS